MPDHIPPAQPGRKTIHAPAGKPAFPRRRAFIAVAAVAVAGTLIGGGAVALNSASHGSEAQAAAPAGAAPELRLGYFGNVTHAPALVGLQQGLFAKELGSTRLSSQVFNAGPAAVEALNAGAIDAAYLGPNPAINSFVKSKGNSIRVIAGAASGGAQLVVKPGINTAADLKGKVLASPQLGGTQDVALRSWLAQQGLKAATTGGGDVTVNPTGNAQTLKLFQDGKLDGAWLPEPWASRLVLQAGAKVLVDEKSLWDKGQFTTTILVVNKDFLANYPDTVKALLKGHVAAVSWLTDNAADVAKETSVVNAGLEKAAGKPLPGNVVRRALKNLTFTADPLAGSWKKLLQDGVDAGLTQPADLAGIFDLASLNAVLEDDGKSAVSASGLGKD